MALNADVPHFGVALFTNEVPVNDGPAADPGPNGEVNQGVNPAVK